MRTTLSTVVRAAALVAAYLFVLAGAMLTYEVIARYFFTRPTSWAAELSQMCLIWGTMLAMARLLETGQHIQVDAIVRHLPARMAHALQGVVLIIVAIFSGYVCVYGYQIFHDSFTRGRTTGSLLNIPIWIVELAIPVGFALLFLQCVPAFLDAVGKARRGTASVIADEHKTV